MSPTASTGMTALRMVRVSNTGRVLEALRAGESTRTELIARTGLSRSTLCAIIADLIEDGSVHEDAAARPTRGRPTGVLRLNRRMAKVAGIEIGRASVSVVTANLAHEIIARARIEVDTLAEPATAVRSGVDMLLDTLADAEPGPRLAAIGIGAPGPGWSPDGGGREVSDQLRQLIKQVVPERLGIVPVVDNNTRLAALAEAQWGSGATVAEQLYVHVDAGVGGGIVVNGHLYRGVAGGAGEIGHLCVDPNGPRCWCGGIGCLERLIALPVLLQTARAHDERELAAAATSSGPARQVVLAAADRLGHALAATVSMLNPNLIVLGGRTAALPGFAERAERTARGLAPSATSPRFARARLGCYAGAMGGVALALRESPLLAGYFAGTRLPQSHEAALTEGM